MLTPDEYLKRANNTLDDMEAHFSQTACRSMYPAVLERLRDLRASRPVVVEIPADPARCPCLVETHGVQHP